MRAAYLWSSCLAIVTLGTVVACTTIPGAKIPLPGVGTLHDRLLAMTARTHVVAEKPHKAHLDSLLMDESLHLKVTNFDAVVGTPKQASSLSTKATADEDAVVLETAATMQAAVGNETPHEIGMVEDLWPVMSDHDNQCTVTDKTTGHSMVCASDQEFQRYTVTSGGQTLRIINNPDGTWTVDGKPAANEQEAAKLIVAHPVGKSASLESLGGVLGTLIERRKIMAAPVTTLAMAMPRECQSPPPGGMPPAYCQSFQRQTLAPTNANYTATNVGPTPGDPTDLLRAVITLREQQP